MFWSRFQTCIIHCVKYSQIDNFLTLCVLQMLPKQPTPLRFTQPIWTYLEQNFCPIERSRARVFRIDVQHHRSRRRSRRHRDSRPQSHWPRLWRIWKGEERSWLAVWPVDVAHLLAHPDWANDLIFLDQLSRWSSLSLLVYKLYNHV